MTVLTGCRRQLCRGASLPILLALVAAVTIPGCSLGVMFGKMFFGDPKISSQFHNATGVDLTKEEKSVLIVCTAPHSILSKHPAVPNAVVDRMTRQLNTRKVKVVDADEVAAWFDDRGEWGDFSELAREFDADYVMSISIESFQIEVPDSPNLIQGKIEGGVKVLAASGDKLKEMSIAFERTFDVMHPQYPVPRENRSEENFVEGFLDRISTNLCHFLLDHRASETVH